MIKHLWSIACSRTSVDKESNNISLFEVLEQFTLSGGPIQQQGKKGVVPILFEIVSLWTKDHENEAVKGRGRTVLVAPSGAETPMLEFDIDLSRHQRLRTINRITGLPIGEGGRHDFRIDLQVNDQWVEQGRVPLQIVFKSEGGIVRP